MKLSVGETAKRYGVSIRTLRYYDEIGLLKPSEISYAGYRYYDDKALKLLTQILFYRELELPLKTITDIITNPEYDGAEALRMHREYMLTKRGRIDEVLKLLDEFEEDKTMSKPKITKEDMQKQKQAYAREADAKWGKTDAYAESVKKHASYDDEKEAQIAEEAEQIFEAFAEVMDKGEDSAEAQALVKRWQAHITRWHYECTKPILANLGEMYVADERFTEHIDRHADGLARFISNAIRAYCAE